MTVEEKMMIAILVGKKSLEHGELPVGAVIYKGDEIIGRAYSSGENSSIYLRHAEILWYEKECQHCKIAKTGK